MARIDDALRTALRAPGAPASLSPTIGALYFRVRVMARAGVPIDALKAAAEGAVSLLAE